LAFERISNITKAIISSFGLIGPHVVRTGAPGRDDASRPCSMPPMLIGMVAGPGISSFALFKTYCCVLSVLPRLLWLPTVCCLHAALDKLDA
jgi:hypothetical protein